MGVLSARQLNQAAKALAPTRETVSTTHLYRVVSVGDATCVLDVGGTQVGAVCEMSAHEGDMVRVRWQDGILYVQGDEDAPATDDTKANEVEVKLEVLEDSIVSSVTDALTGEGSVIEQTVDGITARIDATVRATVQLWYAKAYSAKPSKPTSKVSRTDSAYNAWTQAVPAYDSGYPCYFYCWQYELSDGTFAWSDVVYDQGVSDAASTANRAGATAAGAATTASNANSIATTLSSYVRMTTKGLLVTYKGWSVGALVNSQGSFDVVGLTWNGDAPEIGSALSSLASELNVIGLPDQQHVEVDDKGLRLMPGDSDTDFVGIQGAVAGGRLHGAIVFGEDAYAYQDLFEDGGSEDSEAGLQTQAAASTAANELRFYSAGANPMTVYPAGVEMGSLKVDGKALAQYLWTWRSGVSGSKPAKFQGGQAGAYITVYDTNATQRPTIQYRLHYANGSIAYRTYSNGWSDWSTYVPSHTHSEYAAKDHNHSGEYFSATSSRVKNRVLAAPDGKDGAASFRSLVAADLPTIPQSKGGTGAASLYKVLKPSKKTGSSIASNAADYVDVALNVPSGYTPVAFTKVYTGSSALVVYDFEFPNSSTARVRMRNVHATAAQTPEVTVEVLCLPTAS